MYIDEINILGEKDTVEDRLKRFDILKAEANTVREKDKSIIKSLFRDFYHKQLNIGIGFQRAYGSILAGDYFDLIKLPDGNYLFIFADISGHGLPAYTTLIMFRSAITISIREMRYNYEKTGILDTSFLIKNISRKFTDIMDGANSDDFACVNFTFIYNEKDKFHLKFYNRSMLFPIVVRKNGKELVDIYNLNNKENGWSPQIGYLLGRHLKEIVKDNYYETPYCEFTLNEGDSILFYSDGITEAYNNKIDSGEFGDHRVEQFLRETINLSPQEIIDELFDSVYNFIGHPEQQKDDMTAVLIDFPPAGN